MRGVAALTPSGSAPGVRGWREAVTVKVITGARGEFETVPRYYIYIYNAINLNAESNLGYIWYHLRESRLYSNSLFVCPIPRGDEAERQ